MTAKIISLQMSEQDFTALLAAVNYAYEQIESDLERVMDPEFNKERERLAHLVKELSEAKRTVIEKGAAV